MDATRQNWKRKIELLAAHERSAREIGNVAEADLYAAKIDDLTRKYAKQIAKPKLTLSLEDMIARLYEEITEIEERQHAESMKRIEAHIAYARQQAAGNGGLR